MMTPTARSMTLPLTANSLNSFTMLIVSPWNVVPAQAGTHVDSRLRGNDVHDP
jgi:hypothetical protein